LILCIEKDLESAKQNR